MAMFAEMYSTFLKEDQSPLLAMSLLVNNCVPHQFWSIFFLELCFVMFLRYSSWKSINKLTTWGVSLHTLTLSNQCRTV